MSLKTLLLRAKYKLFISVAPNSVDAPSRKDIRWALTDAEHTRRIYSAMKYYAEGDTLEGIAGFMGCTRERIRQMLWKGLYQTIRQKESK